MSKTNILAAVLVTFFCSLSTPNAGIIDKSYWLVEAGDSVYGIARKMHPNNKTMQARFRKELVKSNPDIFQANANLMSVGSKLKLPNFSIAKSKQWPKQKIKKFTKTKTKTKTYKKRRSTALKVTEKKPKQVKKTNSVVTPDPEDVIGYIVLNIGKAKAINRGATRRLSRHSKILKGDTLRTSSRTHTQIRFKDGALISLRPNTEFLIAEYNYNGREDGTERGIFELLKGGFRTITGAIGHRNKQNYKVRTSVATIGIRGTHYGLMLCGANCTNNPDTNNMNQGLYGGVVDGGIVIQNNAGLFSFNNDQYFHVANANIAPIEQLIPPPVFSSDPAMRRGERHTDDMDPDQEHMGRDGMDHDEMRHEEMGSDGMNPDEMRHDEMGPDGMNPDEMRHDEMGPDGMNPDEMRHDEMGPDGMNPDEMRYQEMGSDGMNPDEMRHDEMGPDGMNPDEMRYQEMGPDGMNPDEMRHQEMEPDGMITEGMGPNDMESDGMMFDRTGTNDMEPDGMMFDGMGTNDMEHDGMMTDMSSGEFDPNNMPSFDEQMSDNTMGEPIIDMFSDIPQDDFVPMSLETENEPLFFAEPRRAPNNSAILVGLMIQGQTGINAIGAPIRVDANNINEILLTDMQSQDGEVIGNIAMYARESHFDSTGGQVEHEFTTFDPNNAQLQPDTFVLPSTIGGHSLGVNWGRWSGNYIVTENGIPQNHTGDLHFIYSENLTDATRLSNLGGLGSNVSYTNNIGGTLPTDHLGNEGTNMARIIVNSDFVGQQVSVDLSVSVGAQSYSNLNNSNIPFDQLNQGIMITESAASNCSGGLAACGGEMSLQFIGPNAEAVMASYGVGDPDGSAGINGTNLISRLPTP